MRKTITYILLIMLTLQITGCGTGSAKQEATGKAADNYVVEALSLPQEYILNETIYQNTLYYLDFLPPADETTTGELIIYRLDLAQEEAVPEAVPFTVSDTENIVAMTADGEGKLNLLIFQSEEKAENILLTDVCWVKLEEDGKVIDFWSVGEQFTNMENPYVTGFEIDAVGNAYIAYSDVNASGMFVADASKRVVEVLECEEAVNALCRNRAGEIYAFWYAFEGEMAMAKIDSTTKTLDVKQDLSWLDNIVGTGSGMDSDRANELFLASEKAVYSYDVVEKTYTEKFQWRALDLAVDYYGTALPLADGRILWIGKKYGDSGIKASFTLIRPRQEDDLPQEAKTVLTFGGIPVFIDGSINEAIADFNRTHPDYRIEIKEYGSDGDVAEGMTRLNADIVSGNGPDILVLPPQFSLKLYADKGVLADLNPYIEQDSTIERTDFQENILKAYEAAGKLYGMPISYTVQTLMGRSTRLGDRHSWNLEEMMAFADSLNGEQMFLDSSKSSVLRLCLMANGDNIVSRNDSRAGFNRELFLKILEFSDRFINDAEFPFDDDEEMYGRIGEEQVQLEESSVSDFTFGQIFKAQFGEPVTYVGYPTESGSGSLAISTTVIAISGKCDEKEAAWQFISSILTEEFQANGSFWGFPIRKSGLERRIEMAMDATYHTDENGNRQEVPKGGIGMGTFYTELYAATAEEVQAVRELIDRVEKISDYDDSIMTIIQEESQGYFNGNKTAAEVADIVENRIGLYLNETAQ